MTPVPSASPLRRPGWLLAGPALRAAAPGASARPAGRARRAGPVREDRRRGQRRRDHLGDVDARGRLFALSTGLPVTPEVLDRLRPQVTQAVDRRAAAAAGGAAAQDRRRATARSPRRSARSRSATACPRARSAASLQGRGVALRTLIDQVRVQLGWTRCCARSSAPRRDISDAEIAEQRRLFKAQTGQPEYHVGEIFIPIDDPAKAGDAQRFAETVIAQLRAGAPFPVVAAQFSQSQTALQGGDLGWVRGQPARPRGGRGGRARCRRARSATRCASRAASSIVTPGRQARDRPRPVDRAEHPPGVHPVQRPSSTRRRRPSSSARRSSRPARSPRARRPAPDMEAANERAGKTRPSDPGPRSGSRASARRRCGHCWPGMPLDQASRPIVANEGVAVLMVCSRDAQDGERAVQAGDHQPAPERAHRARLAPAAARPAAARRAWTCGADNQAPPPAEG